MKRLTEAGPGPYAVLRRAAAAPAPAAADDSTAVTRVIRTEPSEERLIWGTDSGSAALPGRTASEVAKLAPGCHGHGAPSPPVRRSATAAAAAATGDSEEFNWALTPPGRLGESVRR